ncbi:hypothetical protein [Mucilaginibacter sp.]
MKKVTIAAALFLSTGILASCSKQAAIKPTATIEQSTIATKKDAGTAD